MWTDPMFLDDGGAPDSEEVFTDLFETPTDVCDQCASELVGYFKPPVDGAYIFVMASDDEGEFYFGPTEDSMEVICNAPSWASARQYDKYPEQTSAPQQLHADTYYAMRAVANEGGGGDNLSVGVTMPDGTQLWPIPASQGKDGPQLIYFSREQQEKFAGAVHTPGRHVEATGADAAANPGCMYRMWSNIQGGSIEELLADPDYLDNTESPSSQEILMDVFEGPTDICDNCATELVGYFLAPVSGDYIFKIAADDNGALYLGESETVGDTIAECPGWSASRQWDKYPEQTSAPQALIGQNFYFIRAISNEAGGGDNLAVGAILPDGTELLPIPIDGYIFTGEVIEEAEPMAGSLLACNGEAQCTASARYRRWDSIEGNTIEQFLNDPEFLDEEGAPDEEQALAEAFQAPTDVCDNCASEIVGWFKAPVSGRYSFWIASDDQGHLYFGSSENTAEKICEVPGWTNSEQWDKFPEQHSGQLVLVANNYYYMKAISNDGGGGDNLAVGVTMPDGTVVAPIPVSQDGVDYIFSSAQPTPPPEPMRGATDCPGCSPGVSYRRWDEIGGGQAVADMLADPYYLDNTEGEPSAAEHFTDAIESPVNGCDSCGRELSAYFRPPMSGTYVFFLASDDQGALFFGPSEAEAAGIASVPGWTDSRQWDRYPEQESPHQELVAGDYYFLRAVGNEGGGGDNLAVGVMTPTGEVWGPIPVQYGEDSTTLLFTNAAIDAPPPPPPDVAQCEGADRCTGACMQSMVDVVEASCCPDPALCPNGAPTVCNEECAEPFMTMWMACADALGQFQTFHDVCAGNTLCHENQFVKRHQCRNCKPGQTAAAGADPNGPDTRCTAGNGGGH
jgi:hypothetical protein